MWRGEEREEITNYVINFCNKETLLISACLILAVKNIADDEKECVAQWREERTQHQHPGGEQPAN